MDTPCTCIYTSSSDRMLRRNLEINCNLDTRETSWIIWSCTVLCTALHFHFNELHSALHYTLYYLNYLLWSVPYFLSAPVYRYFTKLHCTVNCVQYGLYCLETLPLSCAAPHCLLHCTDYCLLYCTAQNCAGLCCTLYFELTCAALDYSPQHHLLCAGLHCTALCSLLCTALYCAVLSDKQSGEAGPHLPSWKGKT